MAFHEVRFPDNISRGARGGPERRTQIVSLSSGDEERNASWANSRRRYDVSYGVRRADDLAAVIEAKERRLEQLLIRPAVDEQLCQKIADPRWFDLATADELREILAQTRAEVTALPVDVHGLPPEAIPPGVTAVTVACRPCARWKASSPAMSTSPTPSP